VLQLSGILALSVIFPLQSAEHLNDFIFSKSNAMTNLQILRGVFKKKDNAFGQFVRYEGILPG